MSNVWLVSDTHFGHANICKFTNYDGSKLRPWDDVSEMDAALVERWNAAVKPMDKVYHLGDVVMNRKFLPMLSQLNGSKVLIKGNHDIFPLKDYTPYFKDIRGYHVLNGLLMSHIPVHPGSLGRFGCNIHGHLHGGRVQLPEGGVDSRYFSVCVEQHNFTPVSFEEVQKQIVAQGGRVGFSEKGSVAL